MLLKEDDIRAELNINDDANCEGCDNILRLRGISKTFDKKFLALDDINLDLKKSEALGIVGESGSGKSTLARIISRIISADKGSIQFNSKDYTKPNAAMLREYRRQVQMVFQNPASAISPKMNIADFLCEAMVNYKLCSKTEAYGKAEKYLEMVKLDTDLMHRLPHQLSGGQLQRVVIARALSLNPAIIIYDEATAALDVSVQQEVLKLMHELKKEYNNSIIFICHDLAAVRLIADRIIVMYKGKIIEVLDSRDLVKTAKHPYTKKLIASVYDIADKKSV